jgi:hypothetical protein
VDWWRSKELVSDRFAEVSGHIFGPWSRFAVQRRRPPMAFCLQGFELSFFSSTRLDIENGILHILHAFICVSDGEEHESISC